VIILISIHACFLSNRTKKRAGQTVKHAFLRSLSKQQTRKQARQTATAVAQSSPLLWQFTHLSSFDDDPFKFKKSLTDDSSLTRPSISPSKPLLWQFTLSFFGCSSSPFEFKSLTDDCSLSPSILSQFQTEASVDLPLHSTATTTEATTDDPTSPSLPTRRPTSTITVDLPMRSADTATVTGVVGPPRRPTSAHTASVDLSTIAGPPRRPTSTVSFCLLGRLLIVLLSSIMSGLQTPMSLAAQAAADAQAAAQAAAATQAAAQAAAATQAVAAAQAAASTISTADFMKFLQAYKAPTASYY
jgi:hypothetical protein